MKLKIGIIGASGYAGGELLRLLGRHPGVEVKRLGSRTWAGKKVFSVHPGLEGVCDLEFTADYLSFTELDFVFLALPHTHSMVEAAKLKDKNPALKIIDLSADFRLPGDIYESTYQTGHFCPELIVEAVYGLPEYFKEQISSASLTANPGCFANCCILAAAPFAAAGAIEPQIKVSALTGSTGSGAAESPKTHHPRRNEAVSAYKVLGHRHAPEIEYALSLIGKKSFEIELVPQSGPFSRGIFASLFLTLKDKNTKAKEILKDFSENNRFVRFRDGSPNLLDVRGSNFADLAAYQRGQTVVVLSAIDNLVKGAAGNALQCMNIMCGLPEHSGLDLYPFSV